VANLPPSETPEVLDGYYEGSTEKGDEVAFIVSRALPDLQVDRDRPWKIAVITNFKAKLNIHIIDSEEGDYDSPVSFEAENVAVHDNGAFTYRPEDTPFLFLNGVLLPGGQARGTCIGVLNSSSWLRAERATSYAYGSTDWRKWQAVWKDREGVNALRFLP
jgi:hypothetical protein